MSPVIPTPTKRDRIVEELQKLIISGELPRGSRLQQDQLAQRFDTSITPVREALRLLESQGLVTGESHRGVRIATVDEDELKATYLMRRLIEPYAVRRATLRVSRRDLAEAERLNQQMADAGAADDRLAVREANRDLHFVFYDHCGVPALADRIRSLWLVFPWDISLGDVTSRTAESFAEHARLIAAVGAGELDAAAELTATHLLRNYQFVVERLTERPAQDPFPVDND